MVHKRDGKVTMKIFVRMFQVTLIMMSMNFAMPAIAEQAPVYDADNLPPQFDNGTDQSANEGADVYPPAPGAASQDLGSQDVNQYNNQDISGNAPQQFQPVSPPQSTQAAPSASNQPVSRPSRPQPQVQVINPPTAPVDPGFSSQQANNAPLQYSQQSSPSTPPTPQSLSVEQRINQVEQQMGNLQTGEASARINTLQNEVQSLREQVEQLTHQLQQAQSQQKTMYTDLDKRIAQQNSSQAGDQSVAGNNGSANREVQAVAAADGAATAQAIEATSPSAASVTATAQKSSVRKTMTAEKLLIEKSSATGKSSIAQVTVQGTAPVAKTNTAITNSEPNVAEEQQIYQTAYNMIKQKKYNEAARALQKMLQKYPSGQFAANAHYWLGELYGLMAKNDQALTEFTAVVKTFPDSPRVSDAQLKLGLIYASQFKWPEAKTSFKKIINRYPGTASARLAAEQLKQIKQAGH